VQQVVEFVVGEEKSSVVVEERVYSVVVVVVEESVAAADLEKIFAAEVEENFAAVEGKRTVAVVVVWEKSFAVVETVVAVWEKIAEDSVMVKKIVDFVAFWAALEYFAGYLHLKQD